MSKVSWVIVGIGIIVLGVVLIMRSNQFDLPEGQTRPFVEEDEAVSEHSDDMMEETQETAEAQEASAAGDGQGIVAAQSASIQHRGASDRQVFVTDNVKHSIPLNEILSGGPPKDGIPSIDDPIFVSQSEADADLDNEDIGLSVVVDGEERFYPYDVLVWHEIVNDTFGEVPALVTYCPLCRTGVVFERRVNGAVQEFGVSGRLWQSNLLMYNRTGNEETESLWSQVLGEAVLGPETGDRLAIIPSDTVRYGDWKESYPDGVVLSQDTGSIRPYGSDPYGDYYTNNTVSFGATFSDTRLHPKAFVFGVEIDGQHKAYDDEALPVGTTVDTFAGKRIVIEKDATGAVRMEADGAPLPYISGFWFSWLAVHSDSDVFVK